MDESTEKETEKAIKNLIVDAIREVEASRQKRKRRSRNHKPLSRWAKLRKLVHL